MSGVTCRTARRARARQDVLRRISHMPGGPSLAERIDHAGRPSVIRSDDSGGRCPGQPVPPAAVDGAGRGSGLHRDRTDLRGRHGAGALARGAGPACGPVRQRRGGAACRRDGGAGPDHHGLWPFRGGGARLWRLLQRARPGDAGRAGRRGLEGAGDPAADRAGAGAHALLHRLDAAARDGGRAVPRPLPAGPAAAGHAAPAAAAPRHALRPAGNGAADAAGPASAPRHGDAPPAGLPPCAAGRAAGGDPEPARLRADAGGCARRPDLGEPFRQPDAGGGRRHRHRAPGQPARGVAGHDAPAAGPGEPRGPGPARGAAAAKGFGKGVPGPPGHAAHGAGGGAPPPGPAGLAESQRAAAADRSGTGCHAHAGALPAAARDLRADHGRGGGGGLGGAGDRPAGGGTDPGHHRQHGADPCAPRLPQDRGAQPGGAGAAGGAAGPAAGGACRGAAGARRRAGAGRGKARGRGRGRGWGWGRCRAAARPGGLGRRGDLRNGA